MIRLQPTPDPLVIPNTILVKTLERQNITKEILIKSLLVGGKVEKHCYLEGSFAVLQVQQDLLIFAAV